MGNNDVFAVIADKTRRGILTVLKDGERPVGDLVAELGVSQPTVSKHLKILRDAGMVSMEAQGQRRLYAVRSEPLAEVTEWVHGVVAGAAGPVHADHGSAVAVDAAGRGTGAREPGPAVPDTAGEPTASEQGPEAWEPEVAEPAFVLPGTTTEGPAASEQDTEAAEPEVAAPAFVLPGTTTEEPAPREGTGDEDAPVRQELVPRGTDRPEADASPRAGRGAGARAVGLLSNLPGFRRRPRHRRP